ncbi:MAG: DNA gyrase subunit A [Candidatus Lloydbacteria bacterium RIFCSPHIGHO2_01_FULL_49_22]|uniref:DNA gyrase subunit A n=1 Tax=Candidatus Lloydbacteria bacterium RIFCSPHIGHO2_01_FULL_49_22 TaxID=1798658 RepID=A0A1G2CV80_9BACT|nr:MAG: DNA gyrase subunit A [Candidatus Lloydbacteria bacterium RIFCSPHIGHO2_01_FULL_49_22]OGZ10406.1 MAG: DNA gyrase subunit A [Candidatus Lloydbacteria bacterium RIFCSPHIGHO2_02_FULL_50_18]
MSKAVEKKEESPTPEIGTVGVLPVNIVTEMRESFIDYAMSVIVDRALPDVRDGLKPVHRRILYAMHEMGLSSSARFKKSATVVGAVLGSYHPHGDSSVYDAMVKMAQLFSMRYPLVLGQGNFGSIDGDSAAAYRYTEAKMSRIAGEVLRDLDKDTVDFRPNYDGSKKEPSVLPSVVPNLLLNGTLGIAVGMATSIPPHNLGEVVDALTHLIDNPEATGEDLLEFIKGPDFPTGGVAYNKLDIRHAYATGRGGVVCRGEAEIVEQKAGQTEIIITSLPYRVNKAMLLEKIADLVREKKLEGIKDLRDESAKGDIRIAVYLKQGVPPQKVLNYLYKHTEIETTFHYNMVGLVDGVPQTLSIKSILEVFIKHRKAVVKRRTEFDLAKAKDREHILLGLKKALDHIDAIIKLIKASKDTPTAHANLMKEFKFSDKQAAAILEMKLAKLAGLERKKIDDELKALSEIIKELESILASMKKMMGVIKAEMIEMKEKYGDERRTKIMKGGVQTISIEDTIPEKETVLVFSDGGYIKRTDPVEYHTQKRGGVGVMDLDTKEEDFVKMFLTTSTHADILFFTDKGKAYQIKAYELPEGRRATKGKSIMNYLSLGGDESVTSMLAMPKEMKTAEKLSLVMVTECGVVKKVAADGFRDVRRSGLIAIKLQPNDQLLTARFVETGDDISLVSQEGQSIRFKHSDVREMGRSAGGVRGMNLKGKDKIVTADVIKKTDADPLLVVLSEKGYGKMSKLSEYKVQKRGGSGIKTAKVTPKTGKIMTGLVVADRDGEIVAISKNSQVIRVTLKEVPILGRQTQGVRIMKLREGDSIASLITL